MNTTESKLQAPTTPITESLRANWSALLHTFGATLNAAGDAEFVDAPSFEALQQSTTITPLVQHALMTVQGPDAAKFLQGQLTCNVLEVSPTQSTPGAYCTQKGRMLTSFHLAQRDTDHYWLRMRADVLDNSHRTLSKYAVFSKAKLAARDDLFAFGLYGSGAAALLKNIFGALPDAINGTCSNTDGLLLQRDDAGQWFECWLPATLAATFWQRCIPHCSAAGSAYWRWLGIAAGLGEVSATTAELFIPQMLNYQLLGAVSFNKGCYTGQEIIARTHYRGQVKRHLLRAACAAPAPLAGSDIIGANGHAVGNVVNSVAIDAGRVELLAVVADSELELSNFKAAEGGAALTPLPLPYAIH